MSVKRGLEDLSGTEGTKVVGSLPSGWSWRTLKDTTINFDGRRVPIKESDRAKRSGPYPYFGASGVIDDIDNYLFDGDFLLIAEDGANLLSRSSPVAFRASGKFWVNNHAHVVQVLSDVSQSFIEHYLNSIDLKFYVSGSAQPKLTQANLNKIPVPLPPLAEQKRIVAEIEKQFTRLEAGTAALRRVQANLKRYRAAVLKAACEGRLVPTEAELAKTEKRKAKFETGELLLARILKERREKWAGRGKYKEPLGPDKGDYSTLPNGWTLASLGQVLRAPLCNGISVKGSDDPPGIRSLRLSAMSDRGFDYSDARYLPLAEADVDDLWIEEGDFFMSRGNGSLHLVGRGTVATKPPNATIFPDTMIRIRLVNTIQATGWIPAIWSSIMLRSQIESSVKTTAGIYKIAQPQVEGIVLPLPPLAEQTRIVAEVERRLSVIEGLEAMVAANLQRAARLRQAVLQRAFSGQL